MGVSVIAATSSRSTWLTSIDEKPQPLQAGRRARLPHESRECVTGGPVAEAAQVDARQHDLAVSVRDAPPDLGEHGSGRATSRSSADEGNHAERARERAPVLDLHECSDAIEAVVGGHAADRADVAGDEGGRLVACPPSDDDARRQARKGAVEVRGAPGDVHRVRRAGRPADGLTRFRDRLVRHAARVDDLDLASLVDLGVAVREQPLPDRLRVGERDLAPQEARRERRHASPRA